MDGAVLLVMTGTAGDYLVLQCVEMHLSTAVNGKSDTSCTVVVALVVNAVLGMYQVEQSGMLIRGCWGQ